MIAACLLIPLLVRSPSTLPLQALSCRSGTAIWRFLSLLPSPCSIQLKEARPHLALGRTCQPRVAGSLSDGSEGPSFLSGRPRAAQCPIVPRPLQGASSGRGGPGRRCQLFWVPGEGLDLLAVSFFLRRKVSGPSLGGKSVPLALFPTVSPTSSLKKGGGQAGVHLATVFSALRGHHGALLWVRDR